jgi:hypothetical protein
MNEEEKQKLLIQGLLIRQSLNQAEEWENLYKTVDNLRNPKLKRAMLFKAFLYEKMPSLETDAEREKIFTLSPRLQYEYNLLLLKHGLITFSPV